MKASIHTLFLLSLMVLGTQSFGQYYYFENYSVKEGLAQSKVYATFQDSLGNLWIGTPSGVSRFDGREFVNYTTADSLADGGVQAIVASQQGIWFGHIGGGLSFWNGKRFSIVRLSSIDLHSDINDLAVDRQGNVWLATIGSGAIRISDILGANKRVTQYRGKEGLSDRVFRITPAADGTMYFIIDGGIKTFQPDDNGFQFFRPQGLSFFSQITELYEDSRRRLWLGSYTNGLYCYDPATGQTRYFDKKNGLADIFVTSITEDNKGRIWAGTYRSGLAQVVGDTIHSFGMHNGLSDNVIRSLMTDREGNLVIGTYNSGLALFKGDQFVAYDERFGLPSPQVNAILHQNNQIWFGTEKGLMRYDRHSGEKRVFTTADGLLSDEVILLRADRNHNIWVACKEGGVVQFDQKKQRFVNHPRANASSQSEKVRAMEIDAQNNLWVGTWDGVVYYEIDNDTYNLLRQSDGLVGNDIRSIFADSHGRVWFGAVDKGVCYVQGKRFVTALPDTALHIGSFTPSAFGEDKQGNIWIGTEDDGLLLFDGQRISRQYRIEQGLLSNYIASVDVDANNHLWLGTGAGLNQLDPATGRIHFYNEKNGFTGIEVRPKASFRDSLGNIWFGTTRGANVFLAQNETHSTLEPLTRITRLRINLKDRDFEPQMNILLTHKEYAVYIDYSAIWLSNPEGITYKVMLEGLDTDWQPETQRTEINYPYLKPGRYTFRVMARNHEGIWNRVPAELNFYISPPLWQRTWFIVLMLVLVVSVIYLYILWRERNHRLEREKLERIVRERTAEIAHKSDELAERNRDITDSIRYAKRIQHAVLPTRELLDKHLPEHFILFRPRDIVSGDFYWMGHLDHRIIITAVDCTGHGVPGAFLSMLGMSFLNEILSKGLVQQAADVLNHLRRYVIQSLRQTGKAGDSQDGMDMALCIIDPKKRELQFAGANNPMIFISGQEARTIKADNMPIGIYTRGENAFENHTLSYQPGDTFYIFSDGFPDQFGGPSGRKFMRKQFQQVLLGMQDEPMERQGKLLEDLFDTWKGNHFQVDDVLVIGVRL